MREVKEDIRVYCAWRGWCREVLQQVRFWPDHQAIQGELVAHLEDGRADLLRLGYDRDLAEERVLQGMGDPVEIGRALDRAHQPWLGWLWQVSRLLAALALAWALLAVLSNGGLPHVKEWLDPEPVHTEPGSSIKCPPPFRAGAYTIEVTNARYSRNEELGRAELSIDLMSYTPKFWLEGPALGDCLEAVDSNGVRYDWHRAPYIDGSGPNDGHIRDAMWISVWGIEGGPEWIDIRHKTAGWSFRLELPAGEEGAS